MEMNYQLYDDNTSSESEFYGDVSEVEELKQRSKSFNISEWWLLNRTNLTTRALTNTASRKAQSEEKDKRYNPYNGVVGAWQFDEDIEDFLRRLPPATASTEDIGPWIRVANPFSEERLLDHDWGAFKSNAEAIIEEWENHKTRIETENAKKSKLSITRLLTKDRGIVEKRLLALAVEMKCISGKWLLFPTLADQINSSWDRVAKAVTAGRLGTGAKIATDDGSGSSNGRLLCVYTKNFADIEDVTRVLRKLVDLKLVGQESGRSIYYKCDAYTHLGISSKNEWGFKASLYDSKDVLKGKVHTVL